MYRTFHHRERFLWVHFHHDQLYTVLENSGDRHDQLQYCQTANETFFSDNFTLETNQNLPHFDILCVDGAFPDLVDKIGHLTHCYPNEAIIVCPEAWKPLETCKIVPHHGDIYKYFMDSWKYDEYQRANSILLFGGLEPLSDELVAERYYIAGGNCRDFKRGSFVARQRINQEMENEQYRRSFTPTERLTAIFQKKRQVISKYAFDRLAFESSLPHVNLPLETTEDKWFFQGFLEEYDLKQTLKRFNKQLYDQRLYFRKEGCIVIYLPLIITLNLNTSMNMSRPVQFLEIPLVGDLLTKLCTFR
jgi:hypothetical protein